MLLTAGVQRASRRWSYTSSEKGTVQRVILPVLLDCRWEKAIKTHTKPYWIRLPSRLPPALLIWFIGGRPVLELAGFSPLILNNCHDSAQHLHWGWFIMY